MNFAPANQFPNGAPTPSHSIQSYEAPAIFPHASGLISSSNSVSYIDSAVKDEFPLNPRETWILSGVATILPKKPADGSTRLQYLRQWVVQLINETAKSLHHKKVIDPTLH